MTTLLLEIEFNILMLSFNFFNFTTGFSQQNDGKQGGSGGGGSGAGGAGSKQEMHPIDRLAQPTFLILLY